MPRCIVENCKSVVTRKEYDEKIDDKRVSFHFIPKDPIRREKWLDALGLKDVKENSRVCSNHFPDDAFDRSSLSYIRLRDHAIPTFYGSKRKKKKARFFNILETQDDPKDISGPEVVEEVIIDSSSDDEMNLSEVVEEVQSVMEITPPINSPVQDIPNKCKTNVIFCFGDGDVPGVVPLPKTKLDKPPSALPAQYVSWSQTIPCTPQSKLLDDEGELSPCEECGTKRRRCVDRATSVSPERIFNCPDKKRIREHYEKEIQNYKQKMRSLNQKVRRLEAKHVAPAYRETRGVASFAIMRARNTCVEDFNCLTFTDWNLNCRKFQLQNVNKHEKYLYSFMNKDNE